MGNNRNTICPKCGKKMKKCHCAKGKRGWMIFFSVTILLAISVFLMIMPTRKKPSIRVQTEATEVEKQANVTLGWLIENHPDEDVRVGLDSLIRSGKIPLCTKTDIPVEEIVFDNTFDTIGVLVYNPEFIISKDIPDNYKFLVLKHEYEHIKDYVEGKLWKGGKPPSNDQERFEYAKTIWDSDYKALKAEVDLAIRIHAENFCSDECAAYKNGDEKQFRQLLLNLLLNGKVYRDKQELYPYFQRIAQG